MRTLDACVLAIQDHRSNKLCINPIEWGIEENLLPGRNGKVTIKYILNTDPKPVRQGV
jgi:hypothetical protein